MKSPVSVTECKHPRYTHRVRFPGPDGKRADRFFTNFTQAEAFAKEQRKSTGETGSAFGSLAESERAAIAFWRAFSKAASPSPPGLLSVLEDYKVKWNAAKASLKVRDAVERFLIHQEADGSSDRHLATLRSRLGRFTLTFGDTIVSSITTLDFTSWLNGLRGTRADKEGDKLSLVTRTNFTRSTRSFFAFALEQGWTLSNPIPAVKRGKNKASKLAVRKQPEVLSPDSVSDFMNKVWQVFPPLVPFWALKFFAGIRDAECARMEWEMIDLPGGEIHLPSSITKTGDPRTVKIEPNLKTWLAPHSRETGSVAPKEMTRRYYFKKIISALSKENDGKITPFRFPNNAARHSFGTYHLYHFEHAGITALQLGHKDNPSMLHEHYKNSSAQKSAADFWKISAP